MALWQVCPRCGLAVARDMDVHMAWHEAITDDLAAVNDRLDTIAAALPAEPPPLTP